MPTLPLLVVRTLMRRTGVIMLGGTKPSRCAWCNKLLRTGDRVFGFPKDGKGMVACRKCGYDQKRAKNRMIAVGVFMARKYDPRKMPTPPMPKLTAKRFARAVVYLDHALTKLERKEYKKSPASKAHLN